MIRRSSTRIDLVITELTMSEMNGLEVAGQIRAIRSDLPVILTTGFMADLNHS
jgi:CheY-like chemotaxis protein